MWLCTLAYVHVLLVAYQGTAGRELKKGLPDDGDAVHFSRQRT
jgi:hypothetical protein